jgi:GNAT superfamily N-acetyltransferase
LLVRDDNDEILGGLYARLFYQWLFIDLLSVPEQARGQGMGTRLMQMAEDLARERKCIGLARHLRVPGTGVLQEMRLQRDRAHCRLPTGV